MKSKLNFSKHDYINNRIKNQFILLLNLSFEKINFIEIQLSSSKNINTKLIFFQNMSSYFNI